MIKGNTIKFGYGTIIVDHFFNKLIFTSITDPELVGIDIDRLKNNITYSYQISIEFNSYLELRALYLLLETIRTTDLSSFPFKGYIFEFSKNKLASIQVLYKHIEPIINQFKHGSVC